MSLSSLTSSTPTAATARLLQRAAANVEPFTNGVENPPRVCAAAAVRQHELCRARQAACQRIPGVEVKSLLAEHATRDVLVDDAEVVLYEREQHIREHHARLLSQFVPVDFVQRQLPCLPQKQQMGEVVALE